MASLGGLVGAACLVAVTFVSCASPPPGSRGGDGSSPAPRFSASGPDADEYGKAYGYPIGDRSTYFQLPFLVGSHSHLDQIFEGRLVRRAPTPSPLPRAASEPAIRLNVQGQTLTLDDYLARHPTTGLLIARGDTILLERYQYGRNDRHRFTSWSMARQDLVPSVED